VATIRYTTMPSYTRLYLKAGERKLVPMQQSSIRKEMMGKQKDLPSRFTFSLSSTPQPHEPWAMIELCRKMRGKTICTQVFSPDSGVNEKEAGKINAAKLFVSAKNP
jgi:hypothetical protein